MSNPSSQRRPPATSSIKPAGRGGDLFIVDNSDTDWKVRSYLSDWCELSSAIDIATGYFEISALLGLQEKWQTVDHIRILMGDEVSSRTKRAFARGLERIQGQLEQSLEGEKVRNDFLEGVPAIVEAIRSGKIECRVYSRDKFHAKAYITHGRLAVLGSYALVGSSNFTYPGLVSELFAVPTDLNHFWDTTSAMSSLIGLLVNGVFREIGAEVEERMARVSALYGKFIGHTVPGRNPDKA